MKFGLSTDRPETGPPDASSAPAPPPPPTEEDDDDANASLKEPLAAVDDDKDWSPADVVLALDVDVALPFDKVAKKVEKLSILYLIWGTMLIG